MLIRHNSHGDKTCRNNKNRRAISRISSALHLELILSHSAHASSCFWAAFIIPSKNPIENLPRKMFAYFNYISSGLGHVFVRLWQKMYLLISRCSSMTRINLNFFYESPKDEVYFKMSRSRLSECFTRVINC